MNNLELLTEIVDERAAKALIQSYKTLNALAHAEVSEM
jgi:hypothetical protein